MERSQLFGDGEAETEMAFVRPGGVAPVKAVEDMRPDIGGNPAPLVCYGDRHFFPFHRGAYGDLFIGRCIGHGVVQKDGEQLF